MVGGEGTSRTKGGVGGDVVTRSDESSPESEVEKLRGRWELACVLNFLSVFEPIIGNDLKLTAEEIEMGLVESNSSNAQLHIALLKGIPPVSKSLKDSGAWVTVLCKKLAPWWPWIAEGEIPLTACKGEEISKYQELDPTKRLWILKALCEIRADQDDAVSYINVSLKQGTQVSCFCKEKIGGDGNGTSYWFDGNAVQGYRLYREVNQTKRKTKTRGRASLTLSPCFHWETVATNLEEFDKVSSELSSSKLLAVAATGKMIETDAIPVVEKFQKKKERALKRKMREEMLISVSWNFTSTRSRRNRTPVCYTFDEFDRRIHEALRETELLIGASGSNSSSDERSNTTESEAERNKLEASESDDDEYDGEKYEEYYGESHVRDSEVENCDNDNSKNHLESMVDEEPKRRFDGGSGYPVSENRDVSTRNRLRQRPIRNSALEPRVMPDSEDEISGK